MDRMPCFELGDVGSIPAGPANSKEKRMKPVTFENKLNRERVVCDNTKLSQWVDGVEYLAVHRESSPRIFLMRRDSLQKVKAKEKMAR